jgi:hypothetical protein
MPTAPILPTRAQAELLDGDGEAAASRVGREEPRSVEAAGPLRVLYEGHDLLVIDKVHACVLCVCVLRESVCVCLAGCPGKTQPRLMEFCSDVVVDQSDST